MKQICKPGSHEGQRGRYGLLVLGFRSPQSPGFLFFFFFFFLSWLLIVPSQISSVLTTSTWRVLTGAVMGPIRLSARLASPAPWLCAVLQEARDRQWFTSASHPHPTTPPGALAMEGARSG